MWPVIDMKEGFGALGVLAAVAALLLVAGCAGESPEAATVENGSGTPTPEATGTPGPTPSSADVDGDSPASPYRDAMLTRSDLGQDWLTVRKVVRSPGGVSPEARELGWREGYEVVYADRNASDAVQVVEILSVYPEGNASVVMDRAARVASGEELELSVGEESVAHREAVNGSVRYTALFREGRTFVRVGAFGPADREGAVESAFRDAATRAAGKLE